MTIIAAGKLLYIVQYMHAEMCATLLMTGDANND